MLCLFWWLIALDSFAGSATWNLNPTSGDWNTAENWTPETVPNSETDVATFGQSNVTDISISSTTYVADLIFTPDASLYTFTIVPDSIALVLWGDGVINNSLHPQTVIVVEGALNSGYLGFRNTASAGDRMTYLSQGGDIFFLESATAGSATFSIGSAGNLAFAEDTTAANATIINDGFCDTFFSENATAGNALIINRHAGWTDFCAKAGNATIINEGATRRDESPGHTIFCVAGSGDTATIMNNPATIEGGEGGYTSYYTVDFSASPTIINNGSPFGGASAGKTFISGNADNTGNATLIAHGGTNGGAGGAILLEDFAGGEMARVQLDGNGLLDISARKPPGTKIGSVEGDGEIFLGPNNLGIGANNLSTQFSGHIQDGGRHNRTGGAITKMGSGTLTLTGANTYTGGTTVSSGALRVSNTEGSGTGTGNVQVDAGTFGGSGIIAGAVTIGTGSGAGANIQPGFGTRKPTTLSLQGSVTFKADSTYSYRIDTRKAKADQIIAHGVSIESGAHFDLTAVADKKLLSGTVFPAIDNTATTAISGTFSNLADGSILTDGKNRYQVSYSGGDGNDLTLTVVP